MGRRENWTTVMFRQMGMRVLKAAVLALMLMVALPGSAAGDRTVKWKVAPVYPELAKRMKIEGAVKVEASVDADGKVTDVKTISGNHALAVAAEEAVRKWKFVPAASKSTETVEVNFSLGQ